MGNGALESRGLQRKMSLGPPSGGSLWQSGGSLGPRLWRARSDTTTGQHVAESCRGRARQRRKSVPRWRLGIPSAPPAISLSPEISLPELPSPWPFSWLKPLPLFLLSVQFNALQTFSSCSRHCSSPAERLARSLRSLGSHCVFPDNSKEKTLLENYGKFMGRGSSRPFSHSKHFCDQAETGVGPAGRGEGLKGREAPRSVSRFPPPCPAYLWRQ